MTRKPLLTIAALHPDRDVISVGEKLYELRSPSEFGLKDQRKISQLGKRIGVLSNMDAADDDQLEDAEFSLDQLLNMVILEGEELVDMLPSVNKIGIATAFFTQLNNTMTGVQRDAEVVTDTELEIETLIGAR